MPACLPFMRWFVVLTLLAAALAVRGATPLTQPWCGTSNGELRDLWEQTWLEIEALEEMPQAMAWTNAPGRVSMLLTKFAALHRASTRQSQQTMAHVRNVQGGLLQLRPTLISAANSADATPYTQAVAQARLLLANLQRDYSPEALKPGASDLNTFLPGPR